MNWIYVIIYEDEKIECGKWRATVTATSDAATIPGTIQTVMTASMVTYFHAIAPSQLNPSTPGVPVKVACH